MTSAKQEIVVHYESIPTTTVTVNDWNAICTRLDKGEEPVYQMTDKESRALYVWALKYRGYRISTTRVVKGIFKISKKEEKNEEQS